MKIPNAKHAVVDIRKLRDYCLNPLHSVGKRKARLFASALHMAANDAEELRTLLLQAVKTQDAQFGRHDIYGQRYIVDFMVIWHKRKSMIRSAWIIEHDSNVPRLTSCYPL